MRMEYRNWNAVLIFYRIALSQFHPPKSILMHQYYEVRVLWNEKDKRDEN